MNKFLQRFKEPSSWAALAAVAVMFGVRPETASAVVNAVGVVVDLGGAFGVTPETATNFAHTAPAFAMAALAFFLPEKKK